MRRRGVGSEVEAVSTGLQRRVVGETTAAADLVVTDRTVRSADFQNVDLVAQRLPERLVADHVTDGIRGEETEALARGEVLRTVVTEVELGEVLVAEGVGHAAGDTDIPVGPRLQIGGRTQHALAAHVEQEQGAHAVIVGEYAVVGGRRLEVDRRPALGIDVIEAHVTRSGHDLVEHQIALIVAAGRMVLVGVVLAGDAVVAVDIPRELGVHLQALGDDIREVLRQRDERLGHRPVVLRVALVVEHVINVHRAAALGRNRQRAVRIDRRVRNRRRAHRIGVEIVVHVGIHAAGFVLAGVLRRKRKAQLGRFGDVDVDVRTEAEAVEVHLGVVIIVVGHVEHTALRIVGTAHVVADVLVTARRADIHAAGHRQVLVDGVHPVHVRIEVGIGAAQVHLLLIVVDRLDRTLLVGGDFVVVVDPLLGIGHLGDLHRLREAELGLDADLGGPFRTALGGDEHDTVRTAHTVERRGRSVLQNRKRRNVVHVHEVHFALDTVHENQRLVVLAEGVHAADPEIGALTRLARTLHHDDTGQLTGQVRRELSRLHPQFVGVDRVDGADDTLLALLAVGHDRHGLQLGNLRLELDGDIGLGAHRDLLRLVTQIGDLEHVGRGDLEFERAVHVGRNAPRTALDNDGSTRNSGSRLIQHLACQGKSPPPLRSGRRCVHAAFQRGKVGIRAQFRDGHQPQQQHE